MTTDHDNHGSLALQHDAETWKKMRKVVEESLPSAVERHITRKFDNLAEDVKRGLPDTIRDGVHEILRNPDVFPPATPPGGGATPRSSTPPEGDGAAATAPTVPGEPDGSASLDLSGYLCEGFDFVNSLDWSFGIDFAGQPDKESDSGYGSFGASGEPSA